ncbi:helix-turn-helix domain-containing protein [Pelobium manganitolerans]|nr:helix-turn-helix domain-containing protein [Pelobium manganitolerans]
MPKICQIEKAVSNIEKLMNVLIRESMTARTAEALSELTVALQRLPKETNDENEVWFDSYDLMKHYKISRTTLYRWRKNKLLTPSYLGQKYMFKKSDIEKILAQAPT